MNCKLCGALIVRKSWILPKDYVIPEWSETEQEYYECSGCLSRYTPAEIRDGWNLMKLNPNQWWMTLSQEERAEVKRRETDEKDNG